MVKEGVCKWCVFGSVLAALLACLWTFASVSSLFVAWHLRVRAASATPWSRVALTLLLGGEVAAIALACVLVAWLPTMIMTWITAIIFQIPDHMLRTWRHEETRSIVGDGKQLARDISLRSARYVFSQANVLGVTLVVVGLASLLLAKEALDGGRD